MKQSLLLKGVILTLLPFSVFAQSSPEKYSSTITTTDLQKHLTIVAGPDMEGRETATEGQRKAAAYISNQFKSFGLLPKGADNTYLQYFNLMTDTVREADLTIGKNSLVYGTDYIASAMTNKNQSIKGNKVVWVGYGISDPQYDEYAGLDVKGAVVIVTNGEPKKDGKFFINPDGKGSEWSSFQGQSKKIQSAKAKGAAAVFFVNVNADSLNPAAVRNARKRAQYFPSEETQDNYPLNSAVVTPGVLRNLYGVAKADSVIAKIKRAEVLRSADHLVSKEKVKFDFNKEVNVAATSSNVVGIIEGTDKKDEYVVLTAHYDHLGTRNGKIWYGADDDGSGTCAVIEMAEAFAKAKAEGNGPRRTIVFMAVSGEEKGLWGSEYYGAHPIFPLEKTTVNLNTDMVGRIDPKRTYGDSMNYVYVIGDDKLSSDLAPITDTINRKYVNLELDRKYNDLNDPNRFYYRSDHYNFAKKGVPIIFYFNGTHKDYHQPTDTVDKITWEVYKKRVQLVFHTAWEIANMDRMLKRDMELK